MKKLVYLAYYLKNMDWEKFQNFLNYTSKMYNKSQSLLISDIVRSVFKYNISILEYFQFHFANKTIAERSLWAGTGYMYNYQLAMNPVKHRIILDDKRKFAKAYKKYFIHTVAGLDELESNPDLIQNLLNNP